jgi:four helix bundle protein
MCLAAHFQKSFQTGPRGLNATFGKEAMMKNYLDVEDLEVYQKLCRLHIEVCDVSHSWPPEERYEIGSQVRRSSNSSPAQLAEKNDDRHVRNKIEGVNRSRGEASETIHHLFMAREKGYITSKVYDSFRTRYKECIRMLNGLEKTLERKLPQGERRWTIEEPPELYSDRSELPETGWPIFPET